MIILAIALHLTPVRQYRKDGKVESDVREICLAYTAGAYGFQSDELNGFAQNDLEFRTPTLSSLASHQSSSVTLPYDPGF